MKKIIGIIGAAAVAAGLFAVDFSATVQTGASVFGGKTTATNKEYEVSVDGYSANGYEKTSSTDFYALFFDDTKQQDDDLLEVHFEGDRAGANFKFWASLSDSNLALRHLDLWFQPIEQLKVTLGNVTLPLFSEKLEGGRVPLVQSAAAFEAADSSSAWSSSLVSRALGAKADVTVGDLWVGLAFAPGAGESWWKGSIAGSSSTSYTEGGTTVSKDTDGTTTGSYGQWGLGVKYALADLGLTIGGGIRDDGFMSWKQARLGAEFSTDALSAMAQGILRFEVGDNWNGASFEHTTAATWNGEYHLAGFTFDNYVAYDLGFLKAELTAPVTIRTYDPSYFTLRAKVTLPMDAFTLYAVAGNPQEFKVDGGSFKPYYLTQRYKDYEGYTDCWYMDYGAYLNVGVTFNVGSVELDAGVEGEITGEIYNKGLEGGSCSATKTNIAWAIPFTATISF